MTICLNMTTRRSLVTQWVTVLVTFRQIARSVPTNGTTSLFPVDTKTEIQRAQENNSNNSPPPGGELPRTIQCDSCSGPPEYNPTGLPCLLATYFTCSGPRLYRRSVLSHYFTYSGVLRGIKQQRDNWHYGKNVPVAQTGVILTVVVQPIIL